MREVMDKGAVANHALYSIASRFIVTTIIFNIVIAIAESL